MKWRLTFGDPRASSWSVWNSAKVEVGADTPGGILGIGAAVEAAKTKAVVQHVGWVLVEATLVPDEDQIIDWLVPYPVAKLGFDPTAIREVDLRRVWRDPLARTLWLAIKYRHLTNQHFQKECLATAKEIRRLKPKDVYSLELAMRCGMPSHASGITEPFFTQLLPYVLGQKQIGYVFESVSGRPAVPTEVAAR